MQFERVCKKVVGTENPRQNAIAEKKRKEKEA